MPPALYNATLTRWRALPEPSNAQSSALAIYADRIDHAAENLADLAQKQKSVGSMGGGGGGGTRPDIPVLVTQMLTRAGGKS